MLFVHSPRSSASARGDTAIARPSRWRRSALVGAVVLCLVAAGCTPRILDPTGERTSTAALDTFTASNHPRERRADDGVVRIMRGQGRTKIGYMSFPVSRPDGTRLDGTLFLTPRGSGAAVFVRATAPFSDATTHVSRPRLGAEVGRLGRTVAGAPQLVGLRDVRVEAGRVNLALTTSSPTELQIVSREGAVRSRHPERVPTLVIASSAPRTPPRASGAPLAPPRARSAPPSPAPSAWQLTFSDEFNGSSVDPRKWKVYDQSNGDSVESPKSTTCPRADNVSVGGGILRMRTQKANGSCSGGQAQSGAGMSTFGRFGQAGGRFVARGRWTHPGNYLWGGFWTHGEIKGRSNPSEIDIWEYIGKDSQPYTRMYKPAIHYNHTCGYACGLQHLSQQDYDVTAWHTYAVEWEPTNPADPSTMQIRFYLDDRQIALFDKQGTWRVNPDGTKVLEISGGWRNPAGAFPTPFGLDRPHQVTLSAWVGAKGVSDATVAAGYRPAGDHADLEIDYVRVYQRR